jgi:hypothetical protein
MNRFGLNASLSALLFSYAAVDEFQIGDRTILGYGGSQRLESRAITAL